jgi:hypothetical protein
MASDSVLIRMSVSPVHIRHGNVPLGPHNNRKNLPTPRRTELRHGAVSGCLSAVRLEARLPSIFRRRRSFCLGFGLGVAQPGRASRSGAGGAQAGGCPRSSGFCAVAGRETASGPGARKGQICQKRVRFGQLGTQERRPEGQGTQDAHKKQMRGWGHLLLLQLKPPPIWGDASRSLRRR